MSNEPYLGKPFRQFSRRLRIQRGPGKPDKVSERPVQELSDGSIRYLDSDEAPTLITFDEHDQVDIPSLLSIGAIVPWVPSKPPEKPAKSLPRERDPGLEG